MFINDDDEFPTDMSLLIQWRCLESLLSIPCYALENGLLLENNRSLFSDAAVRCVFSDLVER